MHGVHGFKFESGDRIYVAAVSNKMAEPSPKRSKKSEKYFRIEFVGDADRKAALHDKTWIVQNYLHRISGVTVKNYDIFIRQKLCITRFGINP